MAAKIKAPPMNPVPPPAKPVQGKTSPFVMSAPRIKPTQTRNYGKGQSVQTTGPTPQAFGAGVGFGNT